MKKMLIILFISVLCFSFAACGSSPAAQPSSAPVSEETLIPAALSTIKPAATPEPDPSPTADLVVIDGSAITVRDDGSGSDSNQDGMSKRIILTNRSINYEGTTGDFAYVIEGIQIAALTVTDEDTASFLNVEKGKEITVIAIQMSVENTSDKDLSFYPYMSTIVTSDKEQVESNWLLSDSVGGDFLGNVVMEGQIYWICERTGADNLTHIQWRIDAPSDSNYDRCGDPVKIDFEFAK